MNQVKRLPSGLMIHDDGDAPLQEKLIGCCEMFKRKFKHWPSTIWLNPDDLDGHKGPEGLKLIARRDCQPNYFLIGPLRKGG